MGDLGSIPGWGRSPVGGHGNSLWYSYLENPDGQRSLVGCSPWGHKELDRLSDLAHTAYFLLITLSEMVGQQNLEGILENTKCKSLVAQMIKSLQCRRAGFEPWVRKILWRRKWQSTPYSCLENPMDGGAWQATVHGVTKS